MRARLRGLRRCCGCVSGLQPRLEPTRPVPAARDSQPRRPVGVESGP
ncbi:hypothetical protein [Lysobacter gummosus]